MYFVYFINENGRSYSEPSSRGSGKSYFIESAKIFYLGDNIPLTDEKEKYTLPHEILHLFGALDLYKGAYQDKKTEKLAIQHMNKSIMLGHMQNLNEYELDEFNAYLLDLHNNYQKWYGPLSKKCVEEGLIQ